MRELFAKASIEAVALSYQVAGVSKTKRARELAFREYSR